MADSQELREADVGETDNIYTTEAQNTAIVEMQGDAQSTVLVAMQNGGAVGAEPHDGDEGNKAEAQSTSALVVTGGAVVGSAVAVVLAPITAAAVGFTSAGIVAGSSAAAMMSAAAIANGGGVASLSLVAGLQSIGAVGLGTTIPAGIAVLGVAAVLGAAVGALGVGIYLSTRRNRSFWDWAWDVSVSWLMRLTISANTLQPDGKK